MDKHDIGPRKEDIDSFTTVLGDAIGFSVLGLVGVVFALGFVFLFM